MLLREPELEQIRRVSLHERITSARRSCDTRLQCEMVVGPGVGCPGSGLEILEFLMFDRGFGGVMPSRRLETSGKTSKCINRTGAPKPQAKLNSFYSCTC